MSALQELAYNIEAERAAENSHVSPDQRNAQTSGFFNWVARLSIGRKIVVFFGGNLLVALAAATVILFGLYEIADRNAAADDARGHLLIAQSISAAVDTATLQAQVAGNEGNGAWRDAAVASLKGAADHLATLESDASLSGQSVSQDISRLRQSVLDLQNDLQAPARPNAGLADQAEPFQSRMEEACLQAQRIADQFSTQAQAISESIGSLIWSLLTIWGALVTLLCAITIYTQTYFHKRVGRTIEAQAKQMTRLARGERDINISGDDRKDEIGEMANAMHVFQRAAVQLERLSRERAKKAKDELDAQAHLQKEQEDARIERERALGGVADQFERTVGDVVTGVAEASAQLQTTSKMMAQTAEESSKRASELNASMADANSGATAAAAASDEFAMSIGEISRQAASSAELARKATVSANEADTTISALSDSAQQVGQIVELIQTIAQRTNLLALNASIEAARGGEAGRGFAVVASEVKELAMQTSRATEQVAEQIREMQDTTGASVSALRTIGDQIHELETTAVSIASAVDQQSVAGQDLARSIDLAARGTEQVSNHISDVRDLSLTTGSAASQVLSSSTNLEQQAAVLRGQVNEFLAKVRQS